MILLLTSIPSVVLFGVPAALASGITLSEGDGGTSSFPQIVVSGSNVYVVWQAAADSNDVFLASSSNDGAEFGESVNLSNTGTATAPRIAASGSNVYVVWQDSNDVFLASSSNDGAEFGESVNLSNTGTATAPRIAASGSNVYVVWQDSNDVFLASSSNDGANFGSINLSNNTGVSIIPQVAVSGSNVYVVWQDDQDGDLDIFLASSSNDGADFDVMNLSNDEGTSTNQQVAASGSNVYVVWRDDSTGNFEVLASSSTDGGSTFGDAANLSDNEGASTLPQVAASGSNVHVVWEDSSIEPDNNIEILAASSSDGGGNFSSSVNVSVNDAASQTAQLAVSSSGDVFVVWSDKELGTLNPEIYLAVSNDGGISFGSPVNLSANSGASTAPQVALAGDGSNLHVVWHDLTSGTREVMVQSDISPEGPSIVLNPISNTEPIWDGIEPVVASGSVGNAAVDDKVLIDWGDSSSEETAISDAAWGPLEHVYGADAVGNNTIVAKLLASDDSEKAISSSILVTVRSHVVSLTLDPIPSVIQGLDVTVGGVLVDEELGSPVEGMIITFSGNGSSGLSSATSDQVGLFSTTGPSVNETADGWEVVAHFEGNSLYEGTDSELGTYNTIGLSTESFPVTIGQDQQVDLTHFNATIIFEDVATAGDLFVTKCSAPESDMYTALEDGCLSVSPGFQLAEGTVALLNMTYSGTDIPSIFHETDSGDIIDITHSIDPASHTVVGQTSEFSNFILGLPNHDMEPGAYATQIFVGNDNQVSLRDIGNTGPASFDVQFDDSTYTTSQDGKLTVTDSEANVDSSQQESVLTGIMSETSDPITVLLTLTETTASSGVFEGTFGFTSGESTLIGGPLQAANGDDISGFYIPRARFSAEIDGVTESDLVLLSDQLVSGGCNVVGGDLIFDQPIGNGIKLELLNSDFGPGANITATLSYANADLGGVAPSELKMLHHDGASWSDITLASGALDATAKTVTGEATSEGIFTLGVLHDSCIGGVGGGFGRGLVVDAVASVAKQSSSSGGGGGGGGGSRSSVSQTFPSGSSTVQSGLEVITTANIQAFTGYWGGEVTLSFDNVVTPGTINVEEHQLSTTQNMFTSITSSHGMMSSTDGSQFSTAGPIFELDTAGGLQYEGMVDVTIPYNEALAGSAFASSASQEDNVRFMHYDGSGWTDLTVSIDTEANTVTGRMSSFSQVVAAVAEDGTFGRLYFAENPMERFAPVIASHDVNATGIVFADPQGNTVVSVSNGQDITIVTTVKNLQRVTQDYVYIMEVLDSRGIVMDIDMASGSINSTQAATILDGSLHAGNEKRAYTIKVFLITPDESPEFLAPVLVAKIPTVNTT